MQVINLLYLLFAFVLWLRRTYKPDRDLRYVFCCTQTVLRCNALNEDHVLFGQLNVAYLYLDRHEWTHFVITSTTCKQPRPVLLIYKLQSTPVDIFCCRFSRVLSVPIGVYTRPTCMHELTCVCDNWQCPVVAWLRVWDPRPQPWSSTTSNLSGCVYL